MKKLIGAMLGIILCLNFSSRKSLDGSDKPDINVQGAIVDAAGNTIHGVNLTIGGTYERICFYMITADKNKLPEHRVYIDLKNIKRIEVVMQPSGSPLLHALGSQKYDEVVVTSKDTIPTVQHYLMEKDKLIRFEVEGTNGVIQHELPLHAVRSITIDKAISRYVVAPGID